MIFEAILLTVITASTPLVIAAMGELVTERSGVLNLGVEGMMIVGAVCAFAVAQMSGSPLIGVGAGILAGALFSLLFAFLTLTLVANQVATGLALTILGLGVWACWVKASSACPASSSSRSPFRCWRRSPSSVRCCSGRT